MSKTLYAVCNRLLDPEEPRHCEFDGDVEFAEGKPTYCPLCRGRLGSESNEEAQP